MKIQPVLILICGVALLGLSTLVVFQKGFSTINKERKPVPEKQTNRVIKKSSLNLNQVIMRNKIIDLEKQIKQLSKQQGHIIHAMENMLVKLQKTTVVCESMCLAEDNRKTTL